jgi:3-carboxy-cis,cis-muconate cycloisomerase
MLDAVSDAAWVQAMLDVEAALARVESRLGIIPISAADAIVAHCQVAEFDIAELGRKAVDAANPVVPLVSALRARVPKDAASFVHYGATSQDILDTAMMLIARRALDLILQDLARAAATTAALADRHRSTVMAARTLLQQALVTTFGVKAAGWLASIIESRAMLASMHNHRLALQFGGAVGTLAALSDRGPEVARALAAELGLWEPLMPWHTARARVVELGSALAIASGVAGKVALDVILLAQTEVGEVSLRSSGRGGSSTLPQKQNPVNAVEILAAVRGVNAQVAGLLGTMLQEHERAAGAWQSEWPAVCNALRLTGGAASRLADILEEIEVDTERMRQNLGLSGGLIMSEHIVMMLSERVDGVTARKLVDAAVSRTINSGRLFNEVLIEDPMITAQLPPPQLAKGLDPYSYLGASDQLIDRTLGAYREHSKQVRRRVKGET